MIQKPLSKTRWKAHSIATSEIFDSYDGIISALHQLHMDTTAKGKTRNPAINILNKMEDFEFMVMLYLWSYMLDEFHKTVNQKHGLELLQIYIRRSPSVFLV